MLRKRSHQAFTDMEAEQPLSPVLRPPHQEMGSGDSGNDGDEVMGTGNTSASNRVTASMCAAHSLQMQGDTSLQHTHTHKFASSHAVTTNATPLVCWVPVAPQDLQTHMLID